jgi:hypothetical protein
MNKIAIRSIQLMLGLALPDGTANAHAQMALKGRLLFQDNSKTPTNYSS